MLGVYIHIPFCKKICHYCDFCKVLYETNYVSSYLDALEKEINLRYKGEVIDSIYIGGGTPSILNNIELDRLFDILSVFKLNDRCEYTVECNIDNINIDKIKIFKKNGVNRISIGVESFDSNIGKILGRRCDRQLVFKNIKLLKEYFDNINIDLIYGVNQDIDIIKNDIECFLKLDIPHVSCYSLILEEHTKLYIDNYKNISEDSEYEMYKYIKNILSKHGYKHYEISNYARDGFESVHNKNYWLNGNYYGFGLGAVSYLDNFRMMNTKNMHKYLDGDYVYDKIYENERIQKENDLILGLRMIEGINILKFNQKYNDDLLNRKVIKDLINDNYLILSKNNIKCNQKYLYMENMILEKILGSDL